MVLIFKGVSSLACAVLWFAGTVRCPRAVRAGFVLLCEILTFPVLAFAGVSTHRKNAWLKVCHMLLICVSFLCSVTLGSPVYLAVFLVCENRVCLVFLDSLGNECGFFNVVILLNNFKCSSYVYIICVYLLKRKKKRSNSFQKGKEIGRNTFKPKYYFPKGFSCCWSNSFFVFSLCVTYIAFFLLTPKCKLLSLRSVFHKILETFFST